MASTWLAAVGESVSEAATREVKEETGIDVEVTESVGIYSDLRHAIAYDDEDVRQQFSICFRARPTVRQLAGSSESSEVGWVPVRDVVSLNMHRRRGCERPSGRPVARCRENRRSFFGPREPGKRRAPAVSA